MITIRYLWFFIILLTLPMAILAQDSSHSIRSMEVSENDFNKIKKQIDYSKTKKSLVPVRPNGKPAKVANKKGLTFPRLKIWQYLVYLLILLIIIFIIIYLLGGIKGSKKLAVLAESDSPSQVEEEDLNSLYQQALSIGDYRLALRLQFIMALKKLHQKNVIIWHAEKTNRQYLNEMQDHNLKLAFRELAYIYEWVWYGNTRLELSTYLQLTPKFTQFLNSLM